jgi:hypothetical protein
VNMEVSSHSGELPDLLKYDSLFRRAHRGVGGNSEKEKEPSKVGFGSSTEPIAGPWAASRTGSHLAVGDSDCGESALARVAYAEVPVGVGIRLLVLLPVVRPEVEGSDCRKGGTEALLELF